jgi:hypothetical protein
MRTALIRTAGALLAAAPALARDVAGLVGVGFVGYGAWLAYPPAGYVVVGFAVLAAVYLSARGG